MNIDINGNWITLFGWSCFTSALHNEPVKILLLLDSCSFIGDEFADVSDNFKSTVSCNGNTYWLINSIDEINNKINQNKP